MAHTRNTKPVIPLGPYRGRVWCNLSADDWKDLGKAVRKRSNALTQAKISKKNLHWMEETASCRVVATVQLLRGGEN